MIKKFYEETGMFVDWNQLKKLPEIDTLIDIGVGPNGTPDLYKRFPNAKLILIDPLDEAKIFALNNLGSRDYDFYQTALGMVDGLESIINVQKELGSSSILKVSDINYIDNSNDKRSITINKLDTVLKEINNFNKIGIKIDVEGFELDVIKGGTETLKKANFVLAEVRHNHESFEGVYGLSEFIYNMQKNNFILTMILTAKPFIADLCFQPIKELDLK
jgi:FkbM family methyltransferase